MTNSTSPHDEELDDELESDGSASAIPGMVATADPTPERNR